jgi:hypothetical protein
MSNRLMMAGGVARRVPHEVLPVVLPARAGMLAKALDWLRGPGGDETDALSARLRRDVGLGEPVLTGLPLAVERSRLRG